MAAVIGAFTFDAMRDHLSPAAYTYSASGGNVQTGQLTPIAGTVLTEKKVATNATAVSTSESYRNIIGALVDVDINGTTIQNCLVIDCRTSLKGTTPNKCLVAEWRLAAPASWSP
jgi:hypothetical protein